MSRRNRVNATGRGTGPIERFIGIRRSLLHSPQFSALSCTSRCLLVELQAMFNGTNNGLIFLSVRDATARLGLAEYKAAQAAFTELRQLGCLWRDFELHRAPSLLLDDSRALPQGAMHVWLYGEGGEDTLQMNQTPDGWEYRNARSRTGVAVPHDEMARFKPVMLKVNGAIQSRCGLPVGNLKAEPVGDTKPQEL